MSTRKNMLCVYQWFLDVSISSFQTIIKIYSLNVYWYGLLNLPCRHIQEIRSSSVPINLTWHFVWVLIFGVTLFLFITTHNLDQKYIFFFSYRIWIHNAFLYTIIDSVPILTNINAFSTTVKPIFHLIFT